MLVLPKHQAFPERNPLWINYTPNELYDNPQLSIKVMGFEYAAFSERWCRHAQIPGKKRWFEVRIKNAKTLVSLSNSERWWSNPACMDKIFWVHQTPLVLKSGDMNYQCYALEYFECQRVKETGKILFGKNPFTSEFPSLAVPVECCHIAWTETSFGYSDHIRHREIPELTQEQKEIQGKKEELKNVIIKQIQEVEPKDMDRVCGRLGDS